MEDAEHSFQSFMLLLTALISLILYKFKMESVNFGAAWVFFNACVPNKRRLDGEIFPAIEQGGWT